MRRHVLSLVWIVALALSVTPCVGALAQQPSADGSVLSGPRFWLASDDRSAPKPIDISRATVLRKRLTLDLNGSSAKEALSAISAQAALRIFYVDNLLTGAQPVRLRAEGITVAAALTHVLADLNVDVLFSPDGSATLVRRSDAVVPLAVGTITGQVTDSLTKLGIWRATVAVQGTPLSTLTDAEGRFTIRQVPVGNRVVSAKFLGYTAATRSVSVAENETDTVTFSLVRSPTALDQVVSTATGEQRYRELGHVVARINADSLVKEAPIKSLSELLTARVPGLLVTGTSGGSVGGNVALRLRGQTTTALDPQTIVIVDGVRYKNTNTVYGRFDDDRALDAEQRSPLNDLNVNDIETVEVVKGPSASTLYGPDAANGVIVITTKRGRPGKAQWRFYAYPDLSTLSVGSKEGRLNYSSYQGWGHVPETGELYAGQCTRDAQRGGQCVLDSLVVVPSRINDPLFSVVAKQRPQWHSGASVSGGTSGLAYFFSTNWDSQTGALRMSPFAERLLKDRLGVQTLSKAMRSPNTQDALNFHTSVSAALSPKSNVSLVAHYTQATQRAITTDVLSTAGDNYPLDPGQTLTARDSLDYLPGWTNADAFLATAEMDVRRLTVALNGTVQPLSWLTLNASIGTDLANTIDRGVRVAGSLNTDDAGQAEEMRRGNTNRNARLGALLTGTRGIWSTRTSLGVDYSYSNLDGMSTYGYGLAPGSTNLSTASSQFSNRIWTESVQLGTYGEEVVGLRDRLFLTGSVRLDGSTTFGDAYAPKPFPKVGMSWIVSDEPFLRVLRNRGLDELRFRVSHGAASRYPTSEMKWGAISAGNAQVEDRTAAEFARVTGSNPDLRPERSRETEYGADATIASKIRIGLTWYQRRTNDGLQFIEGPSGMLGGYVNVGDIEAHGFEATIGSKVFESALAALDLQFAYSYQTNEVLSLGAALGYKSTAGSYMVGYPLGAVFGVRTIGYIDSAGGAPDGWISEGSEVLSSEHEYLGTNFPPHTYTFTPTLNLFGARVRVAALFDRQAGGVVYGTIGTCAIWLHCPAMFLKSTPLLEQARGLAQHNGDFIQSSDFTRWRELSVTGELPASWRRRLHLGRASASLQVRNLMLWAPSSAPDPESVPGLGTTPIGDYGNSRGASGVPLPRSWTIRFDIAP